MKSLVRPTVGSLGSKPGPAIPPYVKSAVNSKVARLAVAEVVEALSFPVAIIEAADGVSVLIVTMPPPIAPGAPAPVQPKLSYFHPNTKRSITFLPEKEKQFQTEKSIGLLQHFIQRKHWYQ